MPQPAPEPRRTPRRLEDLALGDGPPLTTAELARMTGMSAGFIREEIKTGHLRAARIGRGRKRVFRIRLCHARAYARQLGFI